MSKKRSKPERQLKCADRSGENYSAPVMVKKPQNADPYLHAPLHSTNESNQRVCNFKRDKLRNLSISASHYFHLPTSESHFAAGQLLCGFV